MSAKTIIAWIGLSIVAALIVCVLVLAFVPTKIMPTFANQPNEIRIYKMNSDTQESYLVMPGETDYENIYKQIDKLGTYSVLDTLFMGVLGQNYKVKNNGSETTKSVNTLLNDCDYLIELTWKGTEGQQIKNADGSDFKDDTTTSSTRFKFYRAMICVNNTNNSAELNIYLYYSKTGSTTYYSYVAYANENGLYGVVSGLADNKFAP